MWDGIAYGGAFYRKFFRSELISYENLDDLIKESFILVYNVGLDYPSIMKMPQHERYIFLNEYSELMKRQHDNLK